MRQLRRHTDLYICTKNTISLKCCFIPSESTQHGIFFQSDWLVFDVILNEVECDLTALNENETPNHNTNNIYIF